MLITYPKFKKLSIEDRNIFSEITQSFPPYSDFNFTSLWSYNTKDDCEFSFLHNNLVIKYKDYLTDQPFFSFLGNKNVKATIEELIARAEKENVSSTLMLVPESNIIHEIESLRKFFSIEEDINNHDYILSVEKIAELKGNKYDAHRNLIKRFKNTYPNYWITNLDLSDTSIRTKIQNLYVALNNNKNLQETAGNELKAICKLFDIFTYFNIRTIGVYIDDKLVAFSIEEILPDNTYAISHFGKADTSYIGIYKFLENENAKDLLKRGCEYLNYEQDLGIPDLRTTKKLWRPTSYLKKYIIRKKKS